MDTGFKRVVVVVAAVLLALLVGAGVWTAVNSGPDGGSASGEGGGNRAHGGGGGTVEGGGATSRNGQEGSAGGAEKVANNGVVERVKPIKVGMLLSWRTSSEMGWAGKIYGWKTQLKTLQEFEGSEIEVRPILEGGTAKNGWVPEALTEFFPGKEPIDGTDAEALKKLDVIIASSTWRTTQEVVDAMEIAVKSGVGMLNGSGIGKEEPDYSPTHLGTAHLAGLTEGQYSWNSQVVKCRVLKEHPLLGKLELDDVVNLAPNGVNGIMPAEAEGLIGLENAKDVWTVGNAVKGGPYAFYPLYVSSLGKGRVLAVNFAPYKPIPAELQDGTEGRFYVRAVRWLAGRDLD